ncbi:c-type cytochrome [Jannaschia ovalis]|uniref:Cytochrome C n=1 Tax=Jannaschia ovalis TaxID=3038773 RepID=A0ABY8LG20_9RHOB|nr:cytochrome C [Jannaschia sp. GRR-S6-38]WGH80244.1 cytochrome C [Jannaschia sp. GRR-S6-38]
MKTLSTLTIAAALLAAAPAFADAHAPDLTASGDAGAGESAFRQCQSCHVVQSPDGEVLAGRAAKTGPNLWGVVGRTYGMVEDFRYSDIMLTAGEQGAIYDEANFVAYVQDPTGHLQEITGEDGRGKMTYKVRKEEDAVNLYAFLAQFGAEDAATN